MRHTTHGDTHAAPFDVNAWPCVAAAIALGTIGVIAFIVQPGLVEGFVTSLHLSPEAANTLAGTEMLGVALATMAVAAAGDRLSWRLMTLAALMLGGLADAASALAVHTQWLGTARFAAGLGHGAIISLSFAIVGLTNRPERNIALYLVALLTYGAIGLWALPGILAAIGFAPVFLGFAAVTLAAIASVPFLPRSSGARATPPPTAIAANRHIRGAALAGVLAYNIAQGIAWANLALIGTATGLAEQSVANALFLSQVFAVGGALISVALAAWGRRNLLIVTGILGGAASIAGLIGTPGAALFVAAVCGFNLLWNFVLPFILAAVGDLDPHGGMMSPAIAMQMTGLGLGPLLSAQLLAHGGFLTVEAACIASFLTSLALLAVPMSAESRAGE